jgi:hypothetical protein
MFMRRAVFILFTSVLLFTAQTTRSEDTISKIQDASDPSGGDPRQLVSMPEQTRELVRREMLDHLSTLNVIIGYMASNNLDSAANVAETRMGRSSMGKHRATGMGPGRFMPLEMRNIGWGMHDAASELSEAAKQGDIKGAYSALEKVTNACVACHYNYRTR